MNELCVFNLEHDQNKINKLNQNLKEKWDHVMLPYTPMVNWSDEDHFAWENKMIHVATFYSNTRENQILCVIPVESRVTERPFSYIRRINNYYIDRSVKECCHHSCAGSYNASFKIRYILEHSYPCSWFVRHLFYFVH